MGSILPMDGTHAISIAIVGANIVMNPCIEMHNSTQLERFLDDYE